VSLCFIIVIAEFIDNVKYFFQKMTEKEMGGFWVESWLLGSKNQKRTKQADYCELICQIAADAPHASTIERCG